MTGWWVVDFSPEESLDSGCPIAIYSVAHQSQSLNCSHGPHPSRKGGRILGPPLQGSVSVSVTNGCLTITQCDTTKFNVLRDSFWCQIDQYQWTVGLPALTVRLDCQGSHHVYRISVSLGLHIFVETFVASR
jgi:hypothetical protein